MSMKSWQNQRGSLFLKEERCKGCSFCIDLCPKKVLRQSKDMNAKGYHPPELYDVEGCIMCDICTDICPDFAIYRIRGVKDA